MPPKFARTVFVLILLPNVLLAKKNDEWLARERPVISRISIRGTDIFDLERNVSLNHFPYSTINLLHIKTKEHVIRDELLFKVGDRYDPFLIEETERNLRALSFITAARVARFPKSDGTVALVVHVNDSWTTEPQLNLGGVNGIESKEVGFREKNLFGFGKSVKFLYEDGDNFIQREYEYFDPRLFRSRWQLRAEAISKTTGEGRNVRVERPFYSADTPWAARAVHDQSEEVFGDFENNVRVSEYQQTRESNSVYAGVKVGGGRNNVNHVGLRYEKETLSFDASEKTSLARGVPRSRDSRTFFLDLDTTHNDFIKARRLEKMNRVEDINLGPTVIFSPGWSPALVSGERDEASIQSAFDKRYLFKSNHFLFLSGGFSGRDTLRTPVNQMYNIKVKYYQRLSEKNTLVVQNRAEWGDNLDAANLIELGGENGLRGYEHDLFTGTKSWVFNIEDRLFLIDELFNLVAIGGVVFYDAGAAWASGKPVSLSEVKSDIGAGFRFGLTRSSNEVIVRLDFAYRLQRKDTSDPKFVVTFGSGQAF